MKRTISKLAIAAISMIAVTSMAACLDFGGETSSSSDSNSISNNISVSESVSSESSESSSVTEVCEHTYELKNDVKPSCLATGVKTWRCSLCGDEYTEEYGEALGHAGEWVVETEATCEADGESIRICTRCNTEETRTDEALGHSYAEDVTQRVEPTCEDDGKMIEVCSECNGTRETLLPANGHTPDETEGIVTNATCTTDGYTTYHCSVCKNDYQSEIVPALEHNLQLKETVAVSCLTSGYERYECDRDDCTYEEKRNVVDKLPHAFDEAGNCTGGCGKTHTDKSTWLNTKYEVSYNETEGKWSINGADPGTEQISEKITIPARIFQDMKQANKTSFCITMLKRANSTPIFGYNLTGEQADWKYVNNADFTFSELAITDDMLENGFTFHALYADLTQRDPAWGGTIHVTGFDMTIEFFRAFNIDDKTTWVLSEFQGGYNSEKGLWSYNGETPTDGNIIEKNVTIKADVFKALAETKSSFKISLLRQKDGQTPQFGLDIGNGYTYAHNELTSDAITITEEMKQNGLVMKILYLDNTQQNPAWGGTVVVDGFDMQIEFIDKFNVADKATWFRTTYEKSYSSETELWTMLGNIEATTDLVLCAEVVAAMKEEGYTKVQIDFSAIGSEAPAFDVKGAVEKPQNMSWESGEIELTDAMSSDGITLKVFYRDSGWTAGVVLTGFNVKVTFTK